MNDRKLIEEIVSAVLREVDDKNSTEKPGLLIINMSNIMSDQQRQLLYKDWQLKEIHPSEDQEVPEGITKAVFLGVNQDLLVKSAVGITDTPAAKLFSELMMNDVDINFILNDLFAFKLNRAGKSGKSENYRNFIRKYQDTLEDFGVSFVSVEKLLLEQQKLSRNHTHFDGKLLTQNMLQKFKTDYISIDEKTIITPLAMDSARELNITIKRQNNSGGGYSL